MTIVRAYRSHLFSAVTCYCLTIILRSSSFHGGKAHLDRDEIETASRIELEMARVDATVDRTQHPIRWGNPRGLNVLERLD